MDDADLRRLAKEIGFSLSDEEIDHYRQRLLYFLPYIETVEKAGEGKD